MTNIPIIRVEVEGAKQSIMHMLSRSGDALQNATEAELNRVLEHELAPDRLQQTVQAMAKAHVEAAIKDVVRQYFEHGSGRKTLHAAVSDYLDEVFSVE